MIKKILLICLGTASVFALNSMSVAEAKEPKNLSFVKAALIKYHDSGEYQRDQARVIDKAMQYLKTRLNSRKKSDKAKKFAIVFDIDETALSNYPDMVYLSFGGTLRQIMDAEGNGVDAAIAPTLELYRYAEANHVAVFFVTGRTQPYRAATEKNLKNAGYSHWDGLSFKDENYKESSVAPYKIHARSLIESQGYDIVLNIGDQQSDLIGGHADKAFKLPNPYYYLP